MSAEVETELDRGGSAEGAGVDDLGVHEEVFEVAAGFEAAHAFVKAEVIFVLGETGKLLGLEEGEQGAGGDGVEVVVWVGQLPERSDGCGAVVARTADFRFEESDFCGGCVDTSVLVLARAVPCPIAAWLATKIQDASWAFDLPVFDVCERGDLVQDGRCWAGK